MKQMKNLFFIAGLLLLISCKKDDFKPYYNWDRDFGPYNRISADSLTFDGDLTIQGNPKGFTSVISYTSPIDQRVHIKSNLNLYSTGDFKYFLSTSDTYAAISEHDIYGGVNGVPKLEIDNISLAKGQVLHVYIGISKTNTTIYRNGSYLLIERY
jgi:hypothetical protein